MPSRFQNKLSQFFYRPRKASPALDAVSKGLGEAESALKSTVGGILKKKEPKKKSEKSEKKDKE
ncbi:MAG: hypothetical protein FWB71_02970 [Defluviitaleaceae bacterium]|nr:hypothetical protein [Defluviitaleaceae bacterium]